jgi:hypothetical protein
MEKRQERKTWKWKGEWKKKTRMRKKGVMKVMMWKSGMGEAALTWQKTRKERDVREKLELYDQKQKSETRQVTGQGFSFSVCMRTQLLKEVKKGVKKM